MTTGQLQIHSENILPIIKKWLYSDKDIFVRELIANACDAIQKLKFLHDQDNGIVDTEFRIDVKINKTDRTLQFIDTGIGMTADEVEKYIAQIAFSGAEDFLEKYKTKNTQDQIIGHFGLGFYSAYMAAEKVTIDTLSYQEGATPAFWSCDGSPEYTLETGSRKTRGTALTLYVSEDAEEFLEEPLLHSILSKYCSFLPYPIYLNDKHINPKEPLWIKAPSECSKNDYLEFYRHLYPMEEDPLFWIHLNVDYPFHLKGVLYFPKLKRDLDPTRQSVKLFCNRVFVSSDCKDILPQYLTVMRGALDSPDIPLNVSRSSLQMDRTVRQLASHISKKVADSLSSLYKTDRERFIQCWKDVELIIKFGTLEDEKFYSRIKDFLIWKNTDDKWTTIEEYLERNREKTQNKVFYTSDERHTSQFLQLYKDKGIEVLNSNSYIDNVIISFLEGKLTEVKFQRIDGGIDDTILDKSREQSLLDTEGKTQAARLADFIRAKLDGANVEVQAKSLANDDIPGFIMIDERQRRIRDQLRKLAPSEESMAGLKPTFVVNTNNTLVANLQKLEARDPSLAKEMVQQLYELSLLSQREITPDNLNDFVKRTGNILNQLVEKTIQKA